MVLYIYIYHCYLIVFISHGYLPRDFMKTAIVPIIKNKSIPIPIPMIKQTTDQLH